jgi:predicted nuclease with TOPRIM domain|tara:strand:- start:7741 stop:8148 length:408 start_codon:yes stop_codon:yes gene_type:complete
MLLSFAPSIMKYLLVVGFLGMVIAAGKLYYEDNKNTIDDLTRHNTELSITLNKSLADIQQLIEEKNKLENNTEELRENLIRSEEYQDILLNKFRENDMVLYSLRKPIWMENIINDGTKKIFRDLESDTTIGLQPR